MNFATTTSNTFATIANTDGDTKDFRASIVEFLEQHNELARINDFKITSDMKVTFVNFMNDAFTNHHKADNVEYLMNSNIMMVTATTEDQPYVRVILVADGTKEYIIPGASTGRRAEIESYILVGENIAYDSVCMEIFKKREVKTTKYIWGA